MSETDSSASIDPLAEHYQDSLSRPLPDHYHAGLRAAFAFAIPGLAAAAIFGGAYLLHHDHEKIGRLTVDPALIDGTQPQLEQQRLP